MAQQPATYYEYNDDPEADGILIVETGDEQIRITEKLTTGWSKPVWIPEQEFRAYTHGDSTEKRGTLSDDQFDTVLKKAKA